MKVSPRPWIISNIDVMDSDGRNIIMPNTFEDLTCDVVYPDNLKYMINATNKYDKLLSENKKLKNKIKILELQLQTE